MDPRGPSGPGGHPSSGGARCKSDVTGTMREPFVLSVAKRSRRTAKHHPHPHFPFVLSVAKRSRRTTKHHPHPHLPFVLSVAKRSRRTASRRWPFDFAP